MASHYNEFRRDLRRAAVDRLHVIVALVGLLVDLTVWISAIRWLGVTVGSVLMFHLAFVLALALAAWTLYEAYDAIASRRDEAVRA